MTSNKTVRLFESNETIEQTTIYSRADSGILSISEHAYVNFAFINNLVISPTVCVLGLVGNSLGLGVLWKDSKKQKLSIYKYLCALTFFDIIYLFIGLFRSTPHAIAVYNFPFANFIEEHMKLGTIYLDMLIAHCSTALIVVMSIERLMALWKPLQSRITWLALYPGRIILLCFCVNAIFLLPYAIAFEVGSYVDNNQTRYFIQYKDGYLPFMNAYTIVQIAIDYFVPAGLLVFTNTTIPIVYAKFLKSRENRLNIRNSEVNMHQTKITTTVLCITIMYFLLSIPNLFIKILAFYDDEYSFDGRYKVTFWLFIDISNLFNYINAANDCFIYILNSNHYRLVCVRMYCSCRFRRAPGSPGKESRTGLASVKTESSRF